MSPQRNGRLYRTGGGEDWWLGHMEMKQRSDRDKAGLCVEGSALGLDCKVVPGSYVPGNHKVKVTVEYHGRNILISSCAPGLEAKVTLLCQSDLDLLGRSVMFRSYRSYFLSAKFPTLPSLRDFSGGIMTRY